MKTVFKCFPTINFLYFNISKKLAKCDTYDLFDFLSLPYFQELLVLLQRVFKVTDSRALGLLIKFIRIHFS